MNPKTKKLILGAIIGAIITLGLVGVCSWSTANAIIGGLVGAILGAIIGLMIAVSQAQMERERESGLNS
jgi:gas vesicle protein